MNFNFQEMKSIIQADFDRILDKGPFDIREMVEKFPVGGDAYVRKLAIVETAAECCPVQLFDHYPFAFKLDTGREREITYFGIGDQCFERSGVDFEPYITFGLSLPENNLGRVGNCFDLYHRTLDHDKLLAVGFRGVYEECERLNRTEKDEEKKRYRELVMRVCRAAEKIGLRLREAAMKKLKEEAENADEDVIYNLTRIVHSVNTPWEPPVTLYDAMNTIFVPPILFRCWMACG